MYGIPESCLPKEIVREEIDVLKRWGRLSVILLWAGRTIQELMQEDGFDAVYIGVGAGLPKFMNIEGEQLVGKYRTSI